MKVKKSFFYSLTLLSALWFVSCAAPTISFQVTQAPKYALPGIEAIQMGEFTVGEGKIQPPGSLQKAELKPSVLEFTSNTKTIAMVKEMIGAQILAKISQSSTFQIFTDLQQAPTGAGGSITSPQKIAVITGSVKYFHQSFEKEEKLNYLIKVNNNNLPLEYRLAGQVAAFGVEQTGGGFKESTPYVEQIAAIEVTVNLVRKSNGKSLIPPQTLRSYYIKKWGGDSSTSHLSKLAKEKIQDTYQQDQGLFETFTQASDRTQLSFSDPNEYLARGYNLPRNPNVPATPLEIQVRLISQVANQYARLISPYTKSTDLSIQDGDAVATNLIKGNAYEAAIARLLGLSSRSVEDTYNLGLAYEASGQFLLAKQYYEETLQENSGNDGAKQGLKRVTQ